ncbi:pimeloyl-ACP methyl ester carboxylesterase [Nonomuraea polychroma]|uniref:Pimeloyl-ACP methyl ester carboxylesterase n=1 Tax=Nonomuraea polychroma TaxID=46176 RepID=A0A438M887_9ACTN|nr:alpha/beta hydrolase [Nonomuraea polychroma]RVX41922.1 pimeloyl-ACP methyl ester carboxylesterase [Nonomuraea polychroma]
MTLRRFVRTALLVTGGLLVLAALAAGGYVYRNVTYAERDADGVREAGFVEKQTTVNGSLMNYAEGPDNGTPLLLIHGQSTDWRHWSRVLPDVAERYHVFAIDCYGHGKSARVPEKYTAKALAADTRQFLAQVVKEPAVVVGHSSGGLIAAVLAADAPAQVQALVLEDPPFFSSVLPRAEKTFNYVGLASSAHGFLRSGESDFTAYQIRHGAIWDLFKGAKQSMQKYALSYRKEHPREPLMIFYMPPEFNESFRAMDSYDPRFGETFYDDRFHQGFDHAATLSGIRVPAVLIHVKDLYDDKGILLAAMSTSDAQQARALLKDVRFYQVDSGHGFHFERPDEFNDIMLDLEKRLKK